MKYLKFSVFVLLAVLGFSALSHDYFLLPEKFFLHQGDYLKVHLLVGDDFKKEFERKHQSNKTTLLSLYELSKTTDMMPMVKDSAAPVVNVKLSHKGLAMLALARNYSEITETRPKFLAYLKEEGLNGIDSMVQKNNQQVFKERYTRYVKTLVKVDNSDGPYGKDLNMQLEIILENNPYKAQKGSLITAKVKFRGKPLVNSAIDLYVKTEDAKMYPHRFWTNALGRIEFEIDKTGIYMLRMVHMEPSKDEGVDYDSCWASYTFAFRPDSNLEDKAFGFNN